MSRAARARPIIQMIWTRPIDGQAMAGRLRVAIAVRAAVREVADVREHLLPPAIGSATAMLGIAWAWFCSLFRHPVLPLQCVLYASPGAVRRAIAAIDPEATTIYLDGVRTFALLRRLRKVYPDKRIVVDLDDLMSRRVRLLREGRFPLSAGYLTAALPPTFVRWLTGGVGRMILRYEERTLPGVEAAITHLADAVVLVSSEDLTEMRGDGPATRVSILPMVTPTGRSPTLEPGPVRFIFAGTDTLTQNRLTIDYLTDLWARERPPVELVLIGRRQRTTPLPDGVRALGYIDDIADAYDGRSVLLTPSLLRGGIKTKVLEAFAHGAPVIGNAITFEAMPIGDYPLVCDGEDELIAIIRNPEAFRDRFAVAARFGFDYVQHVHAPDVFARKWRRVLGLEEERADVMAQSA